MQRAHPSARHLISNTTSRSTCHRLCRLAPTATQFSRQLSTKRAPPPNEHSNEDIPSKKPMILAFIVASLGFTAAIINHKDVLENTFKDPAKIFDAPRFTPFTITTKEDVSPTSFILTLRPFKPYTRTEDPYAKEWETCTWSVEFKQPQLQIARLYTPLPPTEHTRAGDLRFLIRKENGGEVSNYLAGLPVGGKVELRGPHPGVDLRGEVKEVVFLAGGTGIAPALQVAYTLLVTRQDDGNKPKIHIVWANQKRADCVGGKTGAGVEGQIKGTIVKELESLQQTYPENFKVDYLVDEEGQFLDKKKVLTLTRTGLPVKYGAVTTRIDSKLLFVSGPEGFVNFIAGPKKWEGGKETQGEIGGLIGKLGLRDWKVWKL